MRRPSWTAIPAARSALPVLRLRLYALLGALLLAASLGVVSTIAWVTADPPVIDFSVARPYAEGHALAITESWLAGQQTSLPVADGIDARFGSQDQASTSSPAPRLTIRSITAFNWTRDLVQGRLVETQYLLVDATETDLVVAVPFVFDKSTPVLAAYPSILPPALTSATPPLEYQDVPGLESVPEPVRERVAEWGAAYASNDGATLRDLADDTNATASQYRGVGGMTLVGTPQVKRAIPGTTGLLLQVRFTFQAAQGVPLVLEFDMLVLAAESFTPRIVAWGPVGSAPTLQAYSNRSF